MFSAPIERLLERFPYPPSCRPKTVESQPEPSNKSNRAQKMYPRSVSSPPADGKGGRTHTPGCPCARCCPAQYTRSGSERHRLSESLNDSLAGLVFGSALGAASGRILKEGEEGAAEARSTPLEDGTGMQVGVSDVGAPAFAERHRGKPFVSRCWVLEERASHRRHPPMAFERAMLILETCLRDDLVRFKCVERVPAGRAD